MTLIPTAPSRRPTHIRAIRSRSRKDNDYVSREVLGLDNDDLNARVVAPQPAARLGEHTAAVLGGAP